MKVNKDTEKVLRSALAKIAQVAKAATDDSDYSENVSDDHQNESNNVSASHAGCTIKSLPDRLQVKAAEYAIKVNPVNAPVLGSLAGASFAQAGAFISDPQFLTLLTSKYWGAAQRRLTVSFMEPTPVDLSRRIISHMNAWSTRIGISFIATAGVGQIRISRQPGGYWSYLGTDVLLIPKNRPTMNLEGFSMATPESEYKRVVRHETGHTLGFPHEHMRQELVARIDPAKAYDYFWRTYRWDRATVDAQVLTSLDNRNIIGTTPDQTSIMCYQLPGSITRDGKPIIGGLDINSTDYAFASKIYPRSGAGNTNEQDQVFQQDSTTKQDDNWDESEDVLDSQVMEAAQAILSQQGDLQEID